MPAGLAAYWAGKRGRSKKRRSNPRRRRAHARRRSSKRYRRNPLNIKRTFSVGNVKSQVMGAIPGAFGALALDVAMGVLPIPLTWKTGNIAYVTKIVGAIALGAVAGMVVNQRIANDMTQGALTVMFHGLLKNLTAQFAPSLTLGAYLGPSAYPGGSIPGVAGLGYYGAGMSPRGALPRSAGGVGAYLPSFTSEVFDEVYGESGGGSGMVSSY
jgi:hypothetical protein